MFLESQESYAAFSGYFFLQPSWILTVGELFMTMATLRNQEGAAATRIHMLGCYVLNLLDTV